jgi:hypothetical protein
MILDLALRLNKIHQSKTIIDHINEFYDYSNNDFEPFYELMELSLAKNRPEFFQLFIDEFQLNPEFLENFLTTKRLYYLYNFKNEEEDEKEAPFSVLFRSKDKSFFSFKYIKKQLNEILEIKIMKEFFSKISETRRFNKSFNIADSLYSASIKWENDENDEILVKNPKGENHAENLFLWAILFNRVEIAKICLPIIEVR